MCSKINAKAPANEMVMGDNMYKNIKNLLLQILYRLIL
jgi:hypothetical protein